MGGAGEIDITRLMPDGGDWLPDQHPESTLYYAAGCGLRGLAFGGLWMMWGLWVGVGVWVGLGG